MIKLVKAIGLRERVLFIGTRFSNLYTAVDTPARGRVGSRISFRIKCATLAHIKKPVQRMLWKDMSG